MALAAQDAGAVIHEGTPSLGIETAGVRVQGVRNSDGLILTGTVVVAAGPCTPQNVKTAGVAVSIAALRVQVAIVQRPLAIESHMIYLDTAAGIFSRPWAQNARLSAQAAATSTTRSPPVTTTRAATMALASWRSPRPSAASLPCAAPPTRTATPASTT